MISGGYKSAPFKAPARTVVMASGRVPLRTGGWFNPSGGAGRSSLPNSGELKFKDNTTTLNPTVGAATWIPFTQAAGAGASQLLNGLVPDSTATGRIGRRVLIKSLYVRVTCRMAATSVGGAPIRMIIVYDKQSNAAAPAVTDVFTTDNFNSMNNISNRDRFVTLVDQIIPTISTSSEPVQHLEVYKKLNLPVQYNAGTAGTIGDITSGAMYMTFVQEGNITVASPAVAYYARVRYTDS